MTADNSQEVVWVATDGYGFLRLYLGTAEHKPKWVEEHKVFHTTDRCSCLGKLPPSWAHRPGAPKPGECKDFVRWMPVLVLDFLKRPYVFPMSEIQERIRERFRSYGFKIGGL